MIVLLVSLLRKLVVFWRQGTLWITTFQQFPSSWNRWSFWEDSPRDIIMKTPLKSGSLGNVNAQDWNTKNRQNSEKIELRIICWMTCSWYFSTTDSFGRFSKQRKQETPILPAPRPTLPKWLVLVIWHFLGIFGRTCMGDWELFKNYEYLES